jgi:hypothetical protein
MLFWYLELVTGLAGFAPTRVMLLAMTALASRSREGNDRTAPVGLIRLDFKLQTNSHRLKPADVTPNLCGAGVEIKDPIKKLQKASQC